MSRITKHSANLIASAAILAVGCAVAAPNQASSGSDTQGAPADIVALVARCAPQVHPATMLRLLKVESGFQPFLIGVNGVDHRVIASASAAAAATKAAELIAAGKNFDIGLAQINSANLERLKLSVNDVLEPCTNIRTGARILTENYVRFRPTVATDQAALDAALSAYNTGKPIDGLANGYVSAIRQNYTVPSINGDDDKQTSESPGAVALPATAVAKSPLDVYGAARADDNAGSTDESKSDNTLSDDADDGVMVFDNKNSSGGTP